MSSSDNQRTTRRRFLASVGASGGVAVTSALAGCSGGGESDAGGETSDASGDGTTASDTEGGGGEAGEALPSYQYFNNPAAYNAARHDAINLIGTRLNDLGLDVGVEVFEWGTLYTRVRDERNFDFCTWNHTHDIYPGLLMNEFFRSSNTDPGEGNFTGWHSEETDELLATALSSSETSERVDALHEFQNTITEAAPTNPIVQMPSVVAYNSDQVSGWVDHVSGPGYFYNMTSIEVDNPENQLRGSWSETIGTLNPVGAPAQTKVSHQLDVLYDNLVRFDGNLEIDPEAGLASDWERPDRTTVRYAIKDHQWHDGEPLTPEDVAFTFNYMKEHGAPLYGTQIQMYEDAEVLDDGRVQINFTEENAPGPVHLLLSSQVPIIPQHIWSERDAPLDMQITEPVGSGPLMFDYWDQGSELSLVKNENHFYPVSFDSRIWRIIPESSTTWELLLNGDLNYLPFSRIGKQLNDNREESQIGVYQMPGNGWWHCSMNTRNPGMDDRAFRQAVVNTLPKTAIVDQILYGFPEPGFNLVNESFGQYHNPDVPRYDESMETARGRLQEAGYVYDDDGTLHFPAE
ncbi:ABC transporter substrate-binding protein [Candidatus Halobonum tyrrellensis]|uniref:ABC transporter substrate-binding protein n=1 Tax=Candidatus Halobonum tyrrellensis G22 TaxID=1324957 RepID=V4HJ08_9EURY|nr:ABC transporter substrate-binding protein [Candidatus Halobonum tyrrellensis]ESP87889.1 ABC transporter substrate-binding protein [Candidatus Halobonum tyrrellensis G22]